MWIRAAIWVTPIVCVFVMLWIDPSSRAFRMLPLRFEHFSRAVWLVFVVVGPVLQTASMALGAWVAATSIGGEFPTVAVIKLFLVFIAMQGTYFFFVTLVDDVVVRGVIGIGLFAAIVNFLPAMPWTSSLGLLLLCSGTAFALSFLRWSYFFSEGSREIMWWTRDLLDSGRGKLVTANVFPAGPPPLNIPAREDSSELIAASKVNGATADPASSSVHINRGIDRMPSLRMRYPLARRLPWYGLLGLFIGIWYGIALAFIAYVIGDQSVGDSPESALHTSGCASLLAILATSFAFMHESAAQTVLRSLPIPRHIRCAYLIAVCAVVCVGTFVGCSPLLSTYWNQSAAQQLHALLYATGATLVIGPLRYAGPVFGIARITGLFSLIMLMIDVVMALLPILLFVLSIPFCLSPENAKLVLPFAGPFLMVLGSSALATQVYQQRHT